MKKRLFSLLLVLCMVMSLFVACGDKKDKDKDEDKASKAESVSDVIESVNGFKKGSFEMGMKMSFENTSMPNLTASFMGKVDGNNASLGLKVNGNVQGVALDFSVDEVIVVADGIAYINLGAIADIAEKVAGTDLSSLLGDTELKWFALPLPDEYNTTATVSEDAQKAAMDFLKDLIATGKEDGMKVTFSEAEQMKSALEVVAVFLETKAPSLMTETAGSNATIDLNAYVAKLIEYYYDDLVTAAESLEMSKDDVDAMIAQIKAEDLNQYLDEVETEVPDSAEFAQMAAEVRKAKDSITDEGMKGGNLTVEASAKGSTYRISASVVNEGAEDAGEISLYYEVSEDSVSVSAPKDLNTLSDLAAILINLSQSGDLDF